jgi:biopolymer transport protein ExbD
MIPLIDVSLVLLIFFMLTASGVGIAATIPTPPAEFAPIVDRPEGVWININLEGDGSNRVPVYAIGQGDKPSPDPEDRDIRSRKELLDRLGKFLKDKGRVELTINAHKEVQSGLVRQLTVELETGPWREKITQKFIGTSER